MNKPLRLPIALALALGAGHALALGLGQIQVKSSLNQPLDAEIEITSATAAELSSLEVKLASQRDLQRLNLPMAGPGANLKFAVEQGPDGRSRIRITSLERITAPFLSFLLDIDWNGGRLLREFTLLLDPPRTAPATPVRSAPARAPQRPVDMASTPAAPAAPAARLSAPASAPAAAPAAAPASAAPATSDAGGEYGPVASGDTLWRIAQRVRPDASITVNQMMAALLRANPDAFFDGNINRLKRGAVLRIPSRDEAESLAAGQAATLVRDQLQAWRGTAPSPQPAESSAAPAASAPATAPAADSRLEIVPPKGEGASGAQSGIAAGGAGTAELKADLARAREEANSAKSEVSELRSRVRDLESIRDQSQRAIELRDSQLAALQKRIAELESTQTATPAAAPAAPSAAAPAAAEPAAPVESAAAPSEAAAPATPAPAEPAAETPAEAPKPAPAPKTEAPEPTPPVAAEPAPQPAWYENIYLLGGLAALVLGLLAFLGLRARGGKPKDARPAPQVVMPAAAAAAAAGAEPLSEEERLLDAVAADPSDPARHLDLVRFYYAEEDADAFEGAAEAMYAQIGDSDGLAWGQVVAMGREILPDHPLFTAPSDAPAAEAVPADDEAPVAEAAGPSDEDAWAPTATAVADTAAFDDFITTPIQDAPAPAAADDDLDLSGVEFNFDLDGADSAATSAPAPATFDLPPLDDAAGFSGGDDDAAATKLELARAYLDMGDVEGARGMLEEVLGEGNPGQRAEAQRLINEIR